MSTATSHTIGDAAGSTSLSTASNGSGCSAPTGGFSRRSAQLLGDPSTSSTCLSRPPAMPPRRPPTTRSSNASSSAASRGFLDVGAFSPYLVGSTAPTRVAGSPRFDFDPRTYAASGMAEAQAVCLPISTRAAAGMASFRVSKRLAQEGTTLILGSGDLAAMTIPMAHRSPPGACSSSGRPHSCEANR
jgi:hypothetical protein